MKILGIIPIRYASTRFPGKAFADIQGKTMIRCVYERAINSKRLAKVIVATDDLRIYDHVKTFSENVLMTSVSHQSGTERCAEVIDIMNEKFEYVINIQGDEPFIKPEQIDLLCSLLGVNTELATLVKKIETEESLFNPNVVKVIVNNYGKAIYFSRQAIPYLRNTEKNEWLQNHVYYKHIGLYAYRTDILKKITKLPVSSLEKAEALEQLRWLENGYEIKITESPYDSIGIDTPEDLEKIKNLSI